MTMNTNPNSPRIVIVGGVAGGASAATRARRLNEHASITLIEKGPDVSFANCGLPYHIGGEITQRSKLALQTPESLAAQVNINVLSLTEAIAINREKKELRIRDVRSGKESTLPYDKLILSPGAAPLRPQLPGIDHPRLFTLRNLQDMDAVKETTAISQSILIIGAGFIGLEVAEQMVKLGKKVTLVELANQVLSPMDRDMTLAITQELLDNGVEVLLEKSVVSFDWLEGERIRARLSSQEDIEADMALLSIGVTPQSALAKQCGLQVGPRGHIVTNAYQQTSDADIYAVGDVCESIEPILGQSTAIALGGPANRQGRVAAEHIFFQEKALAYPGSIGTSIVRVFDMDAGMTGYSEKRLQALGIDYHKSLITDYDHASYFPNATHVSLKVLFKKDSGVILGAQAFGSKGVDKRLDVLATAIKGKLTSEDLEHLELSYAPPFGSAKDPVNIAGFYANNQRKGLVETVFELPDNQETLILDVRPQELSEIAPIPKARNMPFETLRENLGSLDKKTPIVTVCALGKLSYFSARILAQEGFQVKAHGGGEKMLRSLSFPQKEAREIPSNKPDGELYTLDCTGMACPGPILKVKEEASKLQAGESLRVKASDPGFVRDFPAFCKANGYTCLSVEKKEGIVEGSLSVDGLEQRVVPSLTTHANRDLSLVLFSGELDKAIAAFIMANGALAMGGKATIFCTFWGLNVLKKPVVDKKIKKPLMDKLFGAMLPRGADRLPLSNMHMAGLGTRMMKAHMAKKSLPNLVDLIASAQKNGVRLVACAMSMEAMGVSAKECIEGIEFGGVADFLSTSQQSSTQLFI